MFLISRQKAGSWVVGLWIIAVVLLGLMVAPVRAEGYATALVDGRQLFHSGVEAYQRGDYDAAVDRFTQTIQHGSELAAAYHNRCLAHLQLNQYSSAVLDCTQSLQLDPHQPEAYLDRGLAHYRSSNYPAAIADYNQMLQHQPYDYRAYYNRGLAQFAQGNVEQAIADYTLSMHHSPLLPDAQLADIYSDRGVAYLTLGANRNAILDFDRAIAFDQTNGRAYYNRACACHQAGDLAAALQDFTQVLQLNPNHAQAHFSRGMIQQQLGNQRAAIADLQQAADCFCEQGAMAAYHQMLSLIQQIETAYSAIG
ncbi:tetratricopeptide repeat protein [Oculatella sp. LEGE 06141]|uniref:tetratricopeptide repeat protein n=1 Tax=Oculatella sp. LEGE 06141 TaxID=1828648 RepID=UPI00187E502F|nr:tetratricopeptide repeat protein [Oculatella sp. LEGE 06141]MBE9179208.1 tetratricopeptide repeat protein [Oculatella sp. LEGE 06141]